MEHYKKITIFCDCLECQYNAHNNDSSCTLNEIFLDQNKKCESFKETKEDKK